MVIKDAKIAGSATRHSKNPAPEIMGKKPIKILLMAVALVISCQSESSSADVIELIQQGDKALQDNDIKTAEKAFTKALELDPENYRLLQSVAEIKFKIGEYAEAEKLANRVLAMPIAKGRNVLVHLEGESEPLEAEMVDETVMMFPTVTEDMKKGGLEKFLKSPVLEKIPHYRLFFKKTGKMKLVPKVRARIQYVGVSHAVHEKMEILLRKAKKQIIASSITGTTADEMVEIEGGCFLMGSDTGHEDEQPVHEVCLSSFKMDKYEVTQPAFQASMETNPSHFVGSNLPADRVNWIEADQYCRKNGKRLPTEAEWEYAARGGSKTAFYIGDQLTGTIGNFCDSMCDNEHSRTPDITDGFRFTSPVGSFPPNPYGLFDMAGNVAEWVEDWFETNYYRVSPKKDPRGPTPSLYKVTRGGAWLNSAEYLRSARRAYLWPEYRTEAIGFRCVSDIK